MKNKSIMFFIIAIIFMMLFNSCNNKNEKSNSNINIKSDVCISDSSMIASESKTNSANESKINIETNKYKIHEIDDVSFLSDKTGVFSDISTNDDSWFPGKVIRDLATGEVSYIWDRSKETLSLIKKYGAIYRGDETKKECYLTFDCGYEYSNDKYPNGLTPIILDILKDKNVKATFFVTGNYIKENTETVKRMYNEGHCVGTHTANHKHQTTLTPKEFQYEILENERILRSNIPNAPEMTYYRPPEGSANEMTLALAQAMGLTTVFWSATQFDYDVDNQPEYNIALMKDKTMLHNGCVYLIHTISTTHTEILGDLINYIKEEGYQIILFN